MVAPLAFCCYSLFLPALRLCLTGDFCVTLGLEKLIYAK